ncbi:MULTISPECIES: hypothetical protein [Streptomyces]|uniref:hypothetical protein n=1 Tax=Streptomyces TaxID=1883 RepID=UPI00167BA22F|nr:MULTISPECIES: hypothetical protein [Streptomyces]MBD3577614.1 hypothetical protein [Streptomyces sp. KD18]GGT09520.1 hypothetical protein GCM10010286_38750 [Streptomyces toxytricini]
MKLPVTVHEVRLGAREFRVVRPAGPLAHTALVDRDRYIDAHLDADAACSVAALWLLAARSPRSLVHLPLRADRSPVPEAPGPFAGRLDLVLLHHSLQFAPSRWKQLRSRLGHGRPASVAVPGTGRGEASAADDGARHHRENRDLLHQHVHAETLFVTGSAKVFRDTAEHFLEVAREGPGHTPTHRRCPHFCTRLYTDAGILANGREIHIQYRDRWDA